MIYNMFFGNFLWLGRIEVTSNEGERVLVLRHQWSPMIGDEIVGPITNLPWKFIQNCWNIYRLDDEFPFAMTRCFPQIFTELPLKNKKLRERRVWWVQNRGQEKSIAGWWTREFPPNKWLDISGKIWCPELFLRSFWSEPLKKGLIFLCATSINLQPKSPWHVRWFHVFFCKIAGFWSLNCFSDQL